MPFSSTKNDCSVARVTVAPLFPLAVWTPALNPSAQVVTMTRTSKDFFMLNTLSEFTGVTRGVARLTGAGRPPNAQLLQGHLLPPPADKRTKEDFTNRLMAQEMLSRCDESKETPRRRSGERESNLHLRHGVPPP
jgi:hypothetical protein